MYVQNNSGVRSKRALIGVYSRILKKFKMIQFNHRIMKIYRSKYNNRYFFIPPA